MNDRPLSPFLVYRFMYTMALSFAHRITGVFMSIGSLLLVYGLLALSGDAASFARARAFFGWWPVQLLMLGLTVSFFYHLSNGVRHLFWDVGWGFERRQARRSAWWVVISTLALTAAALWTAVCAGRVA
jgi:succinate dehydrogenase / fumarate reductase cytochrome b subunit